jgi:hypothetical protein
MILIAQGWFPVESAAPADAIEAMAVLASGASERRFEILID